MRETPTANDPSTGRRTAGLWRATGVGIGAIVGGGILVLGGTALKTTGPGAIVAFTLNGILAVLTALSFAEMSTAFPESGGAYTFAKKVLSVRAAFVVGWIIWFAYIVAAVLYALGFASYASAAASRIAAEFFGGGPAWIEHRTAIVGLGLVATVGYTLSLIRKATGGAEWATWGKLVVFFLLIAGGFWAFATQPNVSVAERMSPLLPNGVGGLVAAMGFTFIALQGFDLIAAIAGEVKEPTKTIPRAMLLSLGVALGVYLPLLFVVATVGVLPGSSIQSMSESHPDTVMAVAAGHYLGSTGYWLVTVAAILSTLSALHANILAASRIASSMGSDRTLPPILAQTHPTRHTPLMALYASGLAVAATMLMVPNVASAGAAASLIFLMAFALAHWTSYLMRQRTKEASGAEVRISRITASPGEIPGSAAHDPASRVFRSPAFPLVPIIGGVGCIAMAIFQAVTVPSAGGIALVWLGLGLLLYMAVFSGRAQTYDAFAEARDLSLARTRGRSPLILVPVVNPDSAAVMVAMASALAPPKVGRVVLLSVIEPPVGGSEEARAPVIEAVEDLVGRVLRVSLDVGHRPETLITVARQPWREIERVARAHRCEGLLLGLGEQSDASILPKFESLLNSIDCDVAFLRAPTGWQVQRVLRVVLPVGGAGRHHELQARLLGALARDRPITKVWLTVRPTDASDQEIASAKKTLERLAQDQTHGTSVLEVVRSDDPTATILQTAASADLLILGLQRSADGKRTFGALPLAVARRAPCATMLISRGS